MRIFLGMALLSWLFLSPVVSAEVQSFTATHTYILGDHDSKDDARQRCMLEAKRKILEQAGVYTESTSEVKDFQLTKDKVASFASAVMQVKSVQEEVGFQQGHMTLMLTLTATVDLAEVQRQLAARQADTDVRDTVAAQQERLKRLEAQLEGIQQHRHGGQSLPDDASRLTGEITPQDVEDLAARAIGGDAEAQYILAALYENGVGVKQDYSTALLWYGKAAEKGNAWAQNNLGMIYHAGTSVPQDYTRARYWFEKAALQDNAWAQYNLGVMYDHGNGVPQNYAAARKWYGKAAAQGHAKAQSSLGLLYKNGQGVPKDYARAREWYERAATQGDAMGQVLLGMLYDNGEGVKKDYIKARHWYEKAAAQENPMAQVLIGMFYVTGRGVPKDHVRAYMWHYLAAENSTGMEQKMAADSRDTFARLLSPSQLVEAQRLAQQCRAQKFKGC